MRSMGFYLEAALGKLKTILLSLASALPDAPLLQQHSLPEAPAVRSPDDNPLSNTRWVKLAGECVELFAELDRYSQDFDPPRREVAEHVCSRLTEILARNGVSLISEDAAFDRNLHEPDKPVAGLESGSVQARIISPGFRINRRILRRARVETAQEIEVTGD